MKFFLKLIEVTFSKGFIIISSGDTSAFSWKIMGSHYWYCMFPGHISFINEIWCFNIAKIFKTAIIYMRRFSHSENDSSIKFLIDGFKNVVFKISPTVFASLRKLGLGGIDIRKYPELKYFPPNWRSAKDHILVIFQKG